MTLLSTAQHLARSSRKDPRGHIVPILAATLIFQASQVMMFGLIFRALDLPVPITAVIAFAPAVLMLQVLPISFNGLGVRESALVLFRYGFGVTGAAAGTAGLLWYGCLVVVSMLGAPLVAIGHRGPAVAADNGPPAIEHA